MTQMSSTLSTLVRHRHGVVTLDELLVDGYSHAAIRRLVRGRSLVAIHRGVYRWAGVPDVFDLRCAAACLAADDVAVGSIAAARLWSFRHVPKSDLVVVIAPHTRSGLAGAVKVRRTNVFDESIDVVKRDDGIRVTSPPRTWFDCATEVGDDGFEALTEWVLDRHCTVPTLWSMFRRLQGRGRPGAARVRRVLSRRPVWQKPADSRLELGVLLSLERAGVGPMVRQFAVDLPDGSRVHLDGAIPALRWGVEVDHVTWHGGRLDAQYDKQRDRQLRLIGWQVERVTDQELRTDRDAAIESLIELYRLRAASFRR